MLKTEERRIRILEIIREKQEVSVKELLSLLQGVPYASVVRDLRILESKGIITRGYGSIKLSTRSSYISALEMKLGVHQEEKRRIAKATVEIIRSKKGEKVLFFDTGSTALYIARELARQYEPKNGERIMVITNSLPVIRELGGSPHLRIVGIGGIYQFHEECFVGSIAEEEAQLYKASIAIIGADGITAEGGVTSHDPENAGVTRIMAEHSEEVIIVADYTKVGKRGVVPITSPEYIDILVTNREANSEEVKALESKGIKVILS